MTAYGRGRSDLGKIHIIDPAFPRSALCCNSGCCRMVKGDTPGSLAIVDCQRCRRIADRLRTFRTMAEANGGSFSVKSDHLVRSLVDRGVIERVKPAIRGGVHAAFYRFMAK